ncbi:MAG: Vms1/Ankzf1 family peptidyl-tRNA hydrolase [Dehalococcoidia bacterium]
MTRNRVLELLSELESSGNIELSLYLPAGMPIATIREILQNLQGAPENTSEPGDIIHGSKTGAALFLRESGDMVLILPPLPLEKQVLSKHSWTEPIRSLLQRDHTTALVLLHLGSYAIGVFYGEQMVSSKVGTGLVHSRHKKGGSSEGRFKRHREKQMETFFSRVCNHSINQLQPYSRELRYLFYGGEKTTVLSFRRQCRFLERFDSITVENVLNIRQLKQSNLKQAISEALKSRVIEWDPCNLEE